MLRLLLGLLGSLALLPAAAQTLCDAPTIRQLYNGDLGYAVADAQGQLLIPYAQRPLVVLTPALVKVAPGYGPQKWGVLDLKNQPRLPVEYDEYDLEDAGCGYLCARLPGYTSLYDPGGKLVYRRGGRHNLHAYPQWNLLVESNRPPGYQPSAGPDTVRLLYLSTLRELTRQTPATGGQPLYVDGSRRPGQPMRPLPFFAVSLGRGPSGVRDIVRVLDAQGRMRFDSLDGPPHVDGRGTVFVRSLHRPLVIADTLLRPVPWLSGQYDDVVPAGPGLRYWAVTRNNLSGVLDERGRMVLPVNYFGRLEYAGRGCWMLSSWRNPQNLYAVTHELLTRDHRLLDLSPYYLERGVDTTFAARPLLLKNQKTGKYGLLDVERGWLLPPRVDRLEQLGDGLVFFQGDSTGLLDARGRLRLLTPQCQEVSAFFEGRAVCARLVPNATRAQYPSAQVRYSTERGPVALQYAYLDEKGTIVTGYFDWVGAFRDGYAQVIKNNETYLIDRQGQRAELPGGLRLASYFGTSGLAVVQKGKLYGLADRTGRLALPVSYQRIATETAYPQPGNLASRDNSRNHLLQFVTPKLTNGQATVTTPDGQQSQVAVK